MQRKIAFINKGMQRDISVSKASSEYAFENYNIRITARDHNTLLSVTNERGNKEIDLNFNGVLLGHCVLNEFVVLFTIDDSLNYIYKVQYNEADSTFSSTLLYSGNLNFNINYPIETLGIYENENIQKVYWTDGLNQPRMINIMSDISTFTDTSFDFVRTIKLNEQITIEKTNNYSGSFPSGIIQYSFSYFNRYGQESNIFHTSPLYYISYEDRGGGPEDTIGNNFSITIKNPDTSFEYIRIYSTIRTSENSDVEAKKVVDLAIPKEGDINYIDTGIEGESIDPTTLLYIGGEEISSYTMTHKDNTLFLGNINLKRLIIPKEITDTFKNGLIKFANYSKILEGQDHTGFYPYKNQLSLNSYQIKTFKYLEWYRFGIQFQHETGKWSEPIWINDKQNGECTNEQAYFYKDSIKLIRASYVLNNKEVINKLKELGYIKARPVIVYPSYSDRECICQGILCPTVYNVSDRKGNSPFAQSSWFARPNAPFDFNKSINYNSGNDFYNQDWFNRDSELTYNIKSSSSRIGILSNENSAYDGIDTSTFIYKYDIPNKGAWAEFRHNKPIPSNNTRNAEIQCIVDPPADPYVRADYEGGELSWVSDYSENFYIDQSILTFHSPDIEFDESILNSDFSKLKLRIIGMVPLTSFTSDIDIQVSTPPNVYQDTYITTLGFYKEAINASNKITESRFGYRGLLSGLFWFDEVSGPKNGNSNKINRGFAVYPFHRNGSLNNCIKADSSGYKSSLLDTKKLSNLRYSYSSVYFPYNNIWKAYIEGDTDHNGVSGISIFNSNEVTVTKIPAQKEGLDDIIYYGNIDKIVTFSRSLEDKKDGYPLYGNMGEINQSNHDLFISPFEIIPESYSDQRYSTDPVSMKYKSSPHAVLALKYTDSEKQLILPTIYDGDKNSEQWKVNFMGSDTDKGYPFWNKDGNSYVHQDVIDLGDYFVSPAASGTGVDFGFLWLAELYNDEVNNRFGGTTEEAFENNQWLPCGDSVDLLDENKEPLESVTILYTEGDTYYQRYDNIKTYPYTLEDQNCITDIVSFMCETRINLDGRYDKNRGNTSNLAVTRENFNLINNVYNQQNNFFTYRSLNYNKYNINEFPNTLTWSKEKVLGELVDTWTNINMSSTLNLDGDKGSITSLNVFNNEIYCFQDTGFSNILFNSRIQIPTSDGVPIEISNGLKVSGKRYVSNTIGCNNKWSIVESPYGLYFIDNITNSIYLYNGKMNSLSDTNGFRQWLTENTTLEIWNPKDFNNFIGFYDKSNNDVYFVNNKYCLCYSELISKFTSFYSYKEVPAMFTLKDKFLSFKNNKLWIQNEGNYNIYFNEFDDYYVTYIVNPDGKSDRIFNNIEYRADSWDNNILTDSTFDTLDVWNEYQKGTTQLTNIKYKSSSLKKKFRIWRANIPRDNNNKLDRIRNPWIYLKLSKSSENTLRTELHDLIVYYFE